MSEETSPQEHPLASRRLYRYVFKVALIWTQSWNDAEDVTQDILLFALSREDVREMQDADQLRRFLSVKTKWYCIDRFRSDLFADFSPIDDGLSSHEMSVLEIVEERELDAQINDAINSLSPKLAHAARARFWMDKSSLEYAREHNMPHSTAKYRINALLRELRLQLSGLDDQCHDGSLQSRRPCHRDWDFSPGKVFYRGAPLVLRGCKRKLLRSLIASPGPVSAADMASVLPSDLKRPRKILLAKLSELRRQLRNALNLSDRFDPIPCVRTGDGAGWTLQLPSWLVPQ